MKEIAENSDNLSFSGKIQIRTYKKIFIIDIQDIIRCEACKNYTTIHLNNDKSIVASHTLKDFETLLPYPLFLRVHQSHLVNSKFIKQIAKQEASIMLSDHSRIPIATRKQDLITNYLKTVPGL
jgi:two-component system LytT family response regulator